MSAGTVVANDAQNVGQYRLEMFTELDKRARSIEAQNKATWVELAEICCSVRDNRLWQDGGFQSFGEWLKDACPTSRSLAYLAIGIREELKEIGTSQLKKIPLGNANILRDTPKHRRNGHLLEAAMMQPPREFLGTVIEHSPESHLERKHCHKFRLTQSQTKVLMDGFEMWRKLNEDPDAPAEDVLEGIIADFILSHEREIKRLS